MRSQLNPLSRLLSDSKPAVWMPPTDTPPQQRKTRQVSGLAAYIGELRAANERRPPVTKTRLQIQIEERQAREAQKKVEFDRQMSQWDPAKDVNIRGDASCTIIVARLKYSVSEEELRAAFGQYGRIEDMRVVRGRGYAFVVYESAQAARQALQSTANGIVIQGRRIITDLEKGRTQRGWLPRRLGGGLGGRFSLARQKAEMHRAQHIQRNFRAQKRDVRGAFRPHENSGKRNMRDFARRDARRPPPPPPPYDSRRSPAPDSTPAERPAAPQMPPQTARHEPAGRALRRY